jgi:tetratricopeptide (TPR) repeat protein
MYRKGIEVNPDDYLLRIEFIKLLIYQKKFPEALKKLEELEALKLIAYDVEIFNLSGTVNMYLNNVPQAVSYFEKALKIEPGNQGIKLMLARALNSQGKFKKGLAVLLELEKANPENINVLLNIAMSYSELENYDKSVAYFEKIVAKDSSPIHSYYYAVTLSRAGRYDEAVKRMTTFTQLYTQDDARRREAIQLIETWSQAVNTGKTADTGSTARTVQTESADEMFRKAFGFQRSGKPAEALDIYLELEETNPGNFNLIFNMAMVYGMLEKYSYAEDYFNKALNIKPEPVVYFNYAFIMSKAGKYGEAAAKMEKFLELYPNDDETRRNAQQFIVKMKALNED